MKIELVVLLVLFSMYLIVQGVRKARREARNK